MMLIYWPLWFDELTTNGLERERIFAVWGLFVNVVGPGSRDKGEPAIYRCRTQIDSRIKRLLQGNWSRH